MNLDHYINCSFENVNSVIIESTSLLILLFLDLPNLITLEIGQGCLNGVTDDLVISNLPNLEKIVVDKGSLIHLNSLTISNNEKLRDIEVGSSSAKN